MEANRARILLIDDDPILRHIVRAALEKDGYEIAETGSGMDGVEKAKSDRPDLILLDVMMPDLDGYQVCQRLRSHPTTMGIPIIMLTGLGEIAEKVRGMESGADDYITKPFDPRELRSRVEAHLRRSERDLAASPLTNLPGNPIIERVLRARLIAASPLAVLYIDLTNFKSYNDIYGWIKGDQVIRMLAQLILSAVLAQGGKDDFVGHIGGDDFIVISTPDRAECIAQQVVGTFDVAVPPCYDDVDRSRGYVRVIDRQGNTIHAALLTVAIAIVTNEQRPLEHPLQVADVAAEVKRYVKTLPGSRYAFDRRRK